MSLSETSAIPNRRQLHRRRNSGSDELVYPSSSTAMGSHLRSRTERVQHPLGKGAHVNSSTITRPNLARAMEDGIQQQTYNSNDIDGCTAEEYEKTIRRHAERTVIVHEVAPGDSLAGIALKYGLSVAELCRVNGMWPKDSIHLRQVLYIPLDKSAKYMLEPLITLSEDREESGEGSQTNPRRSAIKRIPEWKLSFFPPSTNKALDQSHTADLQRQRYHSTHTPSTSAPSSHSISNLFSSIPVVARLSFDSTITSSDDAELELDHVRPEQQQQHRRNSIDSTHQHTLRPRRAPVNKEPPPAHRSPPIPIFPSPSTVPIRTVQLAPQPDMLLPLASRSHSKPLTMTKSSTEISSL